jgi:hypothetical protein
MSHRVAVMALVAIAASVLPGSAPASSGPPDAHVRDAVERVLDRREQAVGSDDEPGWRATVAEPAAAQVAVFESLRRLNVRRWSERLTTIDPGPAGSWRAAVEVRYRLPGDREDSVVDAVVDLTPRLLVAGVTATPTPPWEIPGVQSVAGRHSLVVGADPADRLRTYAAELDRAVTSVAELLAEPPPRVVLIVPPDWDHAARMIGSGARAGLAAVTGPLEPPGTAPGPVRVLADPAVISGLDPGSRFALFGHEAFHVATHELVAAPRWLSEGLAEYAGYRESGVDLTRATAGLRRQVHRDGVPDVLPDDAAFDDPVRATIAYEGAHVLVRLLVAQHGSGDIVAAFRTLGAERSPGLEAVLTDVLGTDLATVTRGWQTEVTALARR